MSMPWQIFAGALTLSAAVSCTAPSGDVVCTLDFRYGLTIYVRDAVTGAGIADGATVVVRDGSFVDSLTTPFPGSPPGNGSFASAGERAGTYSVTVRRSGYQTWFANGIVVTADQCHVIGKEVVAQLVR